MKKSATSSGGESGGIAAVLEKINSRSALVGIVGLGYVGLPLFLRFSEVGFRVVGFDVDTTKVQALQHGKSYIEHISSHAVRQAFAANAQVTSDFSRAREVDALILCVPTPLSKHREPDLSFVLATLDSLIPNLRAGQLVSLESTTYPGTTDELLLPRIESAGFVVGRDIFLAFSPEREDPANTEYSLSSIPKVCGGVTPHCLEVAAALYESIVCRVVRVSSTRAAELTKLLENIHRAVNIGLVNEMKVVAERMGIDIYEVIRAAATKPFGFVPYYPGPGLGGHCIPIDPFYLTWKAREYGVHTRFIELAGEVNSAMPQYVVDRIIGALNAHSKAVRGSRVLVLGIAYKRNVDDMRESPAIVIIEHLQALGATVDYSDPHIPVFPHIRDHSLSMQSISLTKQTLAAYDCVVVATDHDRFDYDLIKAHAPLIVDTRGRYQDVTQHIVRA